MDCITDLNFPFAVIAAQWEGLSVYNAVLMQAVLSTEYGLLHYFSILIKVN
jgi:hypothetical protein